MNLDHMPTPETDAAQRKCLAAFCVESDFARDLERRLTVARDVLACINSSQIMDAAMHARITETLTQTAPKNKTLPTDDEIWTAWDLAEKNLAKNAPKL